MTKDTKAADILRDCEELLCVAPFPLLKKEVYKGVAQELSMLQNIARVRANLAFDGVLFDGGAGEVTFCWSTFTTAKAAHRDLGSHEEMQSFLMTKIFERGTDGRTKRISDVEVEPDGEEETEQEEDF